MAHALHPNYSDKHEECHRPELQKGLVIKHNANQRYATSAITAFLFKEIARIQNLPVQVLFSFLHYGFISSLVCKDIVMCMKRHGRAIELCNGLKTQANDDLIFFFCLFIIFC